MGRTIDVDDLLDAAGVAELLGLSNANAIATYRGRYIDFPKPAWSSGGGRCQAWARQDIEEWARGRGR